LWWKNLCCDGINPKIKNSKYCREGKMSGDEKFPGKLIFGGKIWAVKG
jgi:hypothetical protein